MKISSLVIISFAVIFLLLLCALPLAEGWGGAFAQCAMCRAITSSNAAGGGTAALGINKAILYLMLTPYALLAAGGGYWYWSKKRKDGKEKSEKSTSM